jgi:P4 family phage/plasmid primase-like protien
MNNNSNGNSVRLSLHELDEQELNNSLEYVTAYARMGLAVVPNKDKKPLLKGWSSKILAEDELPRHFDNGQNVGLINGEPAGGLVVVDMDVPEALKIADKFLPNTLRSGRKSTPGAHIWYAAHRAKTKRYEDTDSRVLLEIRSDGCQTLVEPSRHPGGEHYRWERNGGQEPAEISAEELESRCTELATATVVARHMPPVGGRHEYAKAVIGFLMRRLGKEATLEIARAAWHAADADSADALADLEGIAKDTERRLAEGENVFGAPAVSDLVPRLPELLNRWWGWGGNEHAEAGNVADRNGAPTDDVLRDRFSEAYPHHAYGLSQWKGYEDGVWTPVPELMVKRRIMNVLVEAKPEGVKPNSGKLSSVHELLRVELAVEDGLWDSDPDILVCGNGALHIPTGELLPHSPEHYATGAVPYDYDAHAEAPTWHRVLDEVLGKDIARFFQEYAGYAATPDTSLETALWLCGQPGGGRSTILMGLETMLGSRASVLGLDELESSRFALAEVLGKFLLTATEQPAGYMKISHVLNALISGEPLQAERKFRDPFTLVPRCKIAWAMNDVPRLKSANDGLFRRVKVIQLDPIPEEERDPEIKKKIREEGAGILNWALEGLGRLRERGRFEMPEDVRKATEQFRLANDVPKMFVDEACIVSDAEGCEVQSQKLYEAYRAWCKDNGHTPMSSTAVAREWARLGFGKRKLNGRAIYTGVKVDLGWISARESQPRSW